MNQLVSFLPLILIIAIFYFLIIRPQNKQRQQLDQMRSELKEGDEILTIGGFYGIVYATDDQNVVLELLPDFHKAMVAKTAIARVLNSEESVIVKDEEVDIEKPEEDLEVNVEDTTPEEKIDSEEKEKE